MRTMRRLVAFGLTILFVHGFSTVPLLAADDLLPSQRYTASLSDVRELLSTFAQVVETYNREIGAITEFDLAAAKVQVAEIRQSIEDILGQIGDDSALARSQADLVRWIESNWRQVRADVYLSEERRTYLLSEWSQRADQVTEAASEIEVIRRELTRQLSVVIGDEHYLSQLILLEKADEAGRLIREFLENIRIFSNSIRQRFERVPVPAS